MRRRWHYCMMNFVASVLPAPLSPLTRIDLSRRYTDSGKWTHERIATTVHTNTSQQWCNRKTAEFRFQQERSKPVRVWRAAGRLVFVVGDHRAVHRLSGRKDVRRRLALQLATEALECRGRVQLGQMLPWVDGNQNWTGVSATVEIQSPTLKPCMSAYV